MHIPLATYRLQINRSCTLTKVRSLVPYLRDLGISDLYLSPIFSPYPGSSHGYDVISHEEVNPQIGGEEELAHLVEDLKQHQIGLLLDIVPNHMSIQGTKNSWWIDVLQNGKASYFSQFFDIDWESYDGKVILPILPKSFEEEFAKNSFRLIYKEGKFYLQYGELLLPTNPESWQMILKELAETDIIQQILWAISQLLQNPRQREENIALIIEQLNERVSSKVIQKVIKSFTGQKLGAFIEAQPYRLSYWRNPVNYRRFFDINHLIGIRVEEEEVFYQVHELVLKWVQQKKVQGLRIDHIDGLYDPVGYLRTLRQKIGDVYLLVEKILTDKETLRASFHVAGTTGYEFLNAVNQLQVDLASAWRLKQIYPNTDDPEDVIYQAKMEALRSTLQSDVQMVAKGKEHLQDAILAVIAAFSVYRTYVRLNQEKMDEEDQEVIARALKEARERNPQIDFLELEELLLHDRGPFMMRFQQLTGPAMAKGLEDTALYRYYPLASMNEVGSHLMPLGKSSEAFHHFMRKRARDFPHSLNATTTHDTKRSEDTRARIHLISEDPEGFACFLQKAKEYNLEKKQRAPDDNEEYLLYQTLIGTWRGVADEEYKERIVLYMRKALSEAKVHTSWIDPDAAYLGQVDCFVRSCLSDAAFLQLLDDYAQKLTHPGYLNSLAALVLKCMCPGIPDFYQGSEFWDFSLVDPDNRRTVDYELQQNCRMSSVSLMLAEMDDGRIKMYVTKKCLEIRKRFLALLQSGSYTPLDVGKGAIAFYRSDGKTQLLIVVGRFFLKREEIVLPKTGKNLLIEEEEIPFSQFPFLIAEEAL